MELELFLEKSVEQNASIYFEKAKKAKSKLEGAKEALENSKIKLEKLKKNAIIAKEKLEKVVRKKEWFEKFRWFYSSTGKLILLGRDATTNEILIKKHLEKTDLVFHIDVMKGPFCILKGDDEPTIEEAANATGAFSEAWKRGLAEVEVFKVNPDQVNKQAQSGEYLSKGMFMIYGKKEFKKAKIELALGIYKGAVMCGPPDAIEKNCDKIVKIFPGKEKASKLAKMIQHKLGGGELDDIIRVLPAGGSSL